MTAERCETCGQVLRVETPRCEVCGRWWRTEASIEVCRLECDPDSGKGVKIE